MLGNEARALGGLSPPFDQGNTHPSPSSLLVRSFALMESVLCHFLWMEMWRAGSEVSLPPNTQKNRFPSPSFVLQPLIHDSSCSAMLFWDCSGSWEQLMGTKYETWDERNFGDGYDQAPRSLNNSRDQSTVQGDEKVFTRPRGWSGKAETQHKCFDF